MTSIIEKRLAERRVRKERLDRSLKKIVRELASIGAIRIIVFGSYALGSIRRWSDLDLIVVMPSTKSGRAWFSEIYERVDTDVPADILPFTESELSEKLRTSSFVRHAVRNGRIVYERG